MPEEISFSICYSLPYTQLDLQTCLHLLQIHASFNVSFFSGSLWGLIVGGHFENYPDDRSRNSTECTTFSVMVLGIERHLLSHLQLEMNKMQKFTYTLINMYNDDNDMKFFLHFSRCGYIRSVRSDQISGYIRSVLITDCKYAIFMLVNRKCKIHHICCT